jgi:hypothetical protein
MGSRLPMLFSFSQRSDKNSGVKAGPAESYKRLGRRILPGFSTSVHT